MNIPDDDTGRAIVQWEREGSDLTKPMTIDFFVDVEDEMIGATMRSDIDLSDFKISIEQDAETSRWTCYCTKAMIPDYRAIMDIETRLASIAMRYGATYEGFGSFGSS